MRLQAIEQFIAVVDAGSIRGAARQLNMSQPALSRALQQIEEELGVQLMDRSGRGVTATAAGSAFLSRARVAQAELRKAAEEARKTVGDSTRLLALGVSPVGASLLLPELAITARQYGWSGETAEGFKKRMVQDCLRFKPTIATLCYGMNDHRYKPYDEATAKWYRENYCNFCSDGASEDIQGQRHIF